MEFPALSSRGGAGYFSGKLEKSPKSIEPPVGNWGIKHMSPQSPEDEHRLIFLAQAGDRDAFCELAKGHVASLLRAAIAFGCERSAAEDLAQETLLEAWRSLARFDGRCRLGTWLFGILRNRWLKSLRKQPPVQWKEELTRVTASGAGPAPEALLEKTEESARLRQLLAQLPEHQRSVLELRFFGQASLQEIARELDCQIGTVKSRLHHGLVKLGELEKQRRLKFD